ncbi:MAG: RNA 2',3'-cyclic phosphodiesterase [Bacteroidetes bacterium]|nr:RNA 2',3'-cyclic phosphodiesterase [Bacteroidota bacterium]
MRTFISLNIDDETKKKITGTVERISAELQKTNSAYINYLKWEDEKKYHITLFFIGEVNAEKSKEIESSLSDLRFNFTKNLISFKITKVNAFPNFRYPRVLILDAENEKGETLILSETVKEFMRKAGFVSDKKFHPHITLARVKRDRKVNLTSIKDLFIPEIRFSINKFSLMESRLSPGGAEHSLIKDFFLKYEK